MRGHLKQALVQFGFPAEDLAGYVDGAPLAVGLRDMTLDGRGVRPARLPARGGRRLFWADGRSRGGSRGGRAPLRRGQDRRRGWRHRRRLQLPHADPTAGISRRPPVDPGAARQDRRCTPDQIGEYSGERQGDPARHRRRPTRCSPTGRAAEWRVRALRVQRGRVPAPRALHEPRLGADRLRRGPPAAGARLPGDRRASRRGAASA